MPRVVWVKVTDRKHEEASVRGEHGREANVEGKGRGREAKSSGSDLEHGFELELGNHAEVSNVSNSSSTSRETGSTHSSRNCIVMVKNSPARTMEEPRAPIKKI